MSTSSLEVRLLRFFPFASFFIAGLLAWFGAWAVFGFAQAGTERFGDLTVTTTVSPYAHWAGWIPLILGVFVALHQLVYLIKPPVVLRINDQGVTFGTGFGYHPTTIPLKFVESATDLKTTLVIKFKEDPSIPMALITSMGIDYSLYFLRVRRLFMNRSPKEVVEFTQRLLKKNLA